MKISEYLVGEGPADLTIGIHRNVVWLPGQELAEVGDQWISDRLEDPRSRTAYAFEGRELVLFLRPSSILAVGAWKTNQSFTMWYVYQTKDGQVRAVSAATKWAKTDEQRNRLDMTLADLTAQIKKAGEERAAMSGPFGGDNPIPFVVIDANLLQDYYKAVGAVYTGDRATVLPPPSPLKEDPDQHPGDPTTAPG